MEEDNYIKDNAELLQLLDKEEAVLLFTQQQLEKQQIDSLKQEIELLQTQLKSNEDRKNKLQGSINYLSDEHKKLESRQNKEIEQAKQFCDERNNMIEALPPSLRKKAEEQFKTLSQSQDEFNTKTLKSEKISTSAGFFSRMFHGKELAEFDVQFEGIRKDMENGKIGNFDVSANFSQIADDINHKYDAEKQQLQNQIGEKQKELTLVDENINNDKITLQSKETSLAQNEKSLEDKVNRFSSVYDTHPFIDTQNIDSVVQKAIDNGQILGSEREVKVLAQLLTVGCQNSDIAKEVLYAAIDKGTKYIISEGSSNVHSGGAELGHYSCGMIDISSNLCKVDSPELEVQKIAVIVHESRHACQDTGENIASDNWANTFMQGCLKEIDASSIERGATYQLNQVFGTKSLCYDDDMYSAFSKKYEETKDIKEALNSSALLWDKELGKDYKVGYIREDRCHLAENAETIHPEEIAKRNNIMYQGQSYIDIEKVTEQILTLDKSYFDEITQKGELSGQKDDSLQYFTIKTPEFKKDDKGNILQDEYGFDIIDYKITPPTKQFIYSTKASQTDLSSEKILFNNMTTQQKGAFIQNELRQGKNSFLANDTKPIVPTRETSFEKSKVTSLIQINKGMEM